MTITKDVAAQIEAAYDHRGHVTLTLTDGRIIEGFLYNRELKPLKDEPYIEVIPKDSEARLRFPADQVKSIALTGKDFAQPFVPPTKS